MSLKKSWSQGPEEPCSDVEEQSKVLELRSSLGHLAGRSLKYCSDDCLKRYLCARNWNVKKAEKMLKESIKWRELYKPEDIRWVQVAKESETGKVFRANFVDKFGRTVVIMHPARQVLAQAAHKNTTSHDGQIRQLVYCLENAILNLPANREQMVWLIHFHGWTLYKSVPIKTARETANVLQNHYPERLALAILYNPPRIFETFWAIVKPFLDPKTYRKVRFVYTKSPDTVKVLEDLFDMKDLHSSFGGQNPADYNHEEYGKQMQEDDIKTAQFWNTSETNAEDPRGISSSNPQARVDMNGNVVELLGNGELCSRAATNGGLSQIVAGNHGEDSKVLFSGGSMGTFSLDNKLDSEAVTDCQVTSATV